MQVGPLTIDLHRTVRVADGRQPSNLPPNLGTALATPVKDFKDHCPKSWDEGGFFVALHDTEALWLSFSGGPVAVMIGAGGINALNGQKLGTKLEADGYLVTPPQPWLDGWKAEDGTVYQFVATPFKQGDGLSVGEQILGAESVSGGIGIAVFEPRPGVVLVKQSAPIEGYTGGGAYSDDFTYGGSGGMKGFGGGGVRGMSAGPTRSFRGFEMGVGKGGAIKQKIYADPHGMDVWNDAPTAATAIYLISAADYQEITGVATPVPVGQEVYQGKYFGLNDEDAKGQPGTVTFSVLKSVFAGDTSNVVPVPVGPEGFPFNVPVVTSEAAEAAGYVDLSKTKGVRPANVPKADEAI